MTFNRNSHIVTISMDDETNELRYFLKGKKINLSAFIREKIHEKAAELRAEDNKTEKKNNI